MFWLDPLRQILLFLLIWIGLSVFSLIAQIIIVNSLKIQNPNLNVDDLSSNVDVVMFPNTIAYNLMLVLIVLIIFPFRCKLSSQFNKLKPYFYGLGFTGLLICGSIVWGIISNYLYIAFTGEPPTTGNINQATLEKMIEQAAELYKQKRKLEAQALYEKISYYSDIIQEKKERELVKTA